MFPSKDPLVVGLGIVILILSLSFHELAHAWTAWQLGDPTAKNLGRVSFNPLRHISPLFTILMPIVTFLIAGFPFGGAKPVPVNFQNLKNPRRDDVLVSFAGPMSNVLLACLLAILTTVLLKAGVVDYDPDYQLWDPAPWANLLVYAVFINLLLAAFNALPIPPLDGFSLIRLFLPGKIFWGIRRFEWIGLVVIFGLILFLMHRGIGITFDMFERIPRDFIAFFWRLLFR
ncbi:MAG: site-2 protease family protein [Planctomycetota bacterium]